MYKKIFFILWCIQTASLYAANTYEERNTLETYQYTTTNADSQIVTLYDREALAMLAHRNKTLASAIAQRYHVEYPKNIEIYAIQMKLGFNPGVLITLRIINEQISFENIMSLFPKL